MFKSLTEKGMFGDLASCGHPCNSDGECFLNCSSWPEMAKEAYEIVDQMVVCQRIGEACYAAAISNNNDMAWSRSVVYRALDEAFVNALFFSPYHCSEKESYLVRCLIAEHGATEAARDTIGLGVFSYVQYVRANPDYQGY